MSIDLDVPGHTSEQETGSTAVIVALLLPLLLIVAALAIDIPSFYDRAANIQTAADAAALAGVVEVAAGNDPSAEISEVLRANGLNTSALNVEQRLQGDTLEVSVTDPKAKLFFSSMFVDGVTISRKAKAQLSDRCSDCDVEILIPPPFKSVQVTASGDGFVPVLVGEKMYAINHLATPGRRLICVDRLTNSTCPGYPRALSSQFGNPGLADTDGDYTTSSSPEVTAVGTKLYFVGQRAGDVGVGCWDTVADSSCGYLLMAPLPVGTFYYSTRMHGPDLIGGRLYVMADDHQVYCAIPAPNPRSCSGKWPQASGLLEAKLPPHNWLAAGKRTVALDTEVIGSRIFGIYANPWNHGPVGAGTDSWIHCFDTLQSKPCRDWPEGGQGVRLAGTELSQDPRIFTRYSQAGLPNGVCVYYRFGHQCLDLTGRNQSTIQGFKPFSNSHITFVELYHEGRTYFPSNRSETGCWDWRTGRSCGVKSWLREVGSTGDYGYIADGPCLYGLGHNTVFWSFDADLNTPCAESGTTAQIERCSCDGVEKGWADLMASPVADGEADLFERFDVMIEDEAGTVLLEVDALATGGVIELSSLSSDLHKVVVRVFAAGADGANPWATAGTRPSLVSSGNSSIPRLVE